MQVMPLIGFYYRQHGEIEKQLARAGGGNGAAAVLAFAGAAVPVIKKLWPSLNENGLLDDALATLGEVVAPPAAEVEVTRENTLG